MAYDFAKTSQLMKIVQAYAGHPLGQFTSELGTQLFDCEKALLELERSKIDRQGEIDVANAKFKTEERAHTATRTTLGAEIKSLSDQRAVLVAGLEKIRLDSRGAKAIAAETLAKLNPAPAAVSS